MAWILSRYGNSLFSLSFLDFFGSSFSFSSLLFSPYDYNLFKKIFFIIYFLRLQSKTR